MKTFIKRIYAGLVDALFIALPVGMIYYIYIWQSTKTENFKISYTEVQFNITFITIMFLFIYYTICEVKGTSVGKKIFNLKLIYKGKGTFAKIIRPFIKLITLYFWPLGILSLFLPENRIFYDYILNTDIEEGNTGISGGSL